MRRRTFIAGLGSAAASWPRAARAQNPGMPVVGYIHSATREATLRLVAAFRQGLRDAGFIEGQNVVVEYRFAQDQQDRLPELAADLVRLNVAAIAATGGTRTATIAKAATSKIPIIFEVGADPVRNGLVASLSRPGGNVTGVNSLIADIWSKQFDLLGKLVPNGRIFAILSTGDPTANQLEQLRQEAQPAADAIGRKLLIVTVFNLPELDELFPSLVRQGADALIVRAGPLAYGWREQLAALALRYSIPAIYPTRENVEAGGLMSYGIKVDESFRLVGVYTGRILKGEKPGDLPVQQATKFELVINLKAAKPLSLEIPPTLLALADEVIE
jgi:putative tryptophan/tyrosine transport system substrate-binding protein